MEDTRKLLMAEGYLFINEQDARQASQEQKKIEYLEARMDYSRPENILAVYEKAIRDRVFKTPVGVQYLKRLQTFLVKQPEIDEGRVPPIPLYLTYGSEIRDQTAPARQRIQPAEKKKKPFAALPLSITLNILLIIAILAMFVIMLTSNHENILNYKRVITNRYASWEQELTEREQAVRDKERELNIQNEES